MSKQVEIVSYALWVVGSALFVVSSIRSGDTVALIASVMYLVGATLFCLNVMQRE